MINHISYALTRSIPGPSLKTKGPEEGFEIIKYWTQKYTIGQYSNFELQLTIPRDNYPNLDFLDNTFKRQPLTYTSSEEDYCEWTFVQAELPELFDLIRTNNDFFVDHNYSIKVLVDFIFLDEKGDLLKGQNLYNNEEHSRFLGFINFDSVSIEPTIIFPFGGDSNDFKDFFKYFESIFPFKLNERNLYLTVENHKSKSRYLRRKLRK